MNNWYQTIVFTKNGSFSNRSPAEDVGGHRAEPPTEGGGSSSGCSARSTPQAQTGSSHTVENVPEPLLRGRPNPNDNRPQVTARAARFTSGTEFHLAPARG